MALSFFDDLPIGRLNPLTNNSIGTLEAVTGLTVTHKQLGLGIKTILTLVDVAQTVVNGTEYQSTKLWTFPEGRIALVNSKVTLSEKTTSILADTLNASSTGALSVGTAAASSTTLNSTMANILPSTAFVSSATINVAGTAVTAKLDANGDAAELIVLDGSSTPVPVYFNSAFATTTDVDADATIKWNGTIELFWNYLSASFGY